MKKRQIFTIAACAIAAIFFTCLLVIGLREDAFAASNLGPRSNVYFQEVDPVESMVDSINIDWRDGPITFGYSPDGMIRISESSHTTLAEQDQMNIEVKSGTLNVRWDGRWFRKWFNVGWFGPEDKGLEVLVPEELAKNLEDLDISGSAGPVTLEGFDCSELEISTVSGAVEVTDCTAEEVDVSTVSGSVKLNVVNGTESLDVSTVSGGISVEKSTSGAVSMETVSGAIGYDGEAGTLSISTVSGAVETDLAVCPTEADMESVSGSLRMKLPASADFTAEHDTVSGDFSCGFTGEANGGKFRVGSGGNKLRMSTTSGDMSIERG